MYRRGNKLSKPKTQNKIRNYFSLKKKKKTFKKILKTEEKKEKKKLEREKEINNRLIKERIIRHIRTFFEEEEEEDYDKPKRVSNFWNKNYTEYETSGDTSRNVSLDEYLNKIEPY